MFEAHFTATPEIAASDWPLLSDSQQSEHPLTRRVLSLHHLCPLHVWAAPGKRKDADGQVCEQWFLYIEYCRENGARTCKKLELPRAGGDLEALFDKALWMDLPHIDAQRTRDWLETESDTI